MRLGCRDAHHIGSYVRRSDKAFTWTNARNDHRMIQSHIDRFFIPIRLENIGGTTKILPTLPDVSDHAGVILHFNDEPKRRRRTTTFFNKGLLAQPENKAALLATWKEVMEDATIGSWNQKMVRANQTVIQRSEELTKSQKQKWKETYLSQFEDIIQAEAELQTNWGSKEARDRLSEAQVTLHEVRQQKLQFQETTILSKWTRVGDRCTKEFFEHHTCARRQTPISHMKDADRLITNQAELEEHILNFYRQLYTADEQVETNDAAREDCFRFIKQTVTNEHNVALLMPLTQLEVVEAMKQLPAGKAPGVDAIPSEFYQELWEDIETDVFNFVTESVTQACISEELNVSKIALLPKTRQVKNSKLQAYLLA